MFCKFINSIQIRPLNFTNYSSDTVSEIQMKCMWINSVDFEI